MKVAIFHNLPAGGAKRLAYEQVRELACRGHEIDEFTQSTADLTFMPFAPFVKRTQVYELSWRALRPVAVPGLGPYVHLWQNSRNLSALDRQSRRIATEINAGGYDLAFVHDCMFVVAPMVLRYLRIPSIVYMDSFPEWTASDAHNVWPSVLKRVVAWPAEVHARMVDRLALENLRSATRVLSISQFVRQLRLARDGVDSDVVYPGVDIETFRPRPDARGDYILSAGNLLPAKGHGFVIEALSYLPPDIRPRLVIATPVTDKARQAELEQYAHQHGVALEVTNARSSEAMARLYANALFLAFAPVMERLGLVALEAQACGIPVVGVREGGLLETVQEGITGFLVERDPVKFAAAMRRLIEDDGLRRQMGLQARQAIEAYWTWPRAVDDLEAQFAEALGKAKAR